MARSSRHVSYANVMATIAVFIALGGASYAVVALPSNSVGTRQVKDRSLQIADLSRKAVRKLHGARGATGRAGAAGLPGPKGDTGAKGDKGDTGATGDVATWISATVAADEPLVVGADFGIYADLATPGPQVTVTVPASGLVEVFARAHISGDPTGTGGVGLAIDGTTSGVLKCNVYNGALFIGAASPASDWATAAPPDATHCGTALPGTSQALMLAVAPGTHVFKLVYVGKSSAPPSTVHFSDRRLYVAPRP